MSKTAYFAWEYRGLIDVGAGCRSLLSARFQAMGARRIGIVTDKGLVEAGVAEMVTEVLEAQGAPKVAGIYDKIEVDARSSIVNDCLRWCGEMGVEGLLALGGGSVMDSVKAVKTMMAYGVRDVTEVLRGNAGTYTGLVARPIKFPHIAIPTTAGTGAESSPLAIILVEENNLKGSIMHPDLPAPCVCLDPEVTYTLPPRLTAETGFDALTHAIEALFALSNNSMADALAIHSIGLIRKYLPIAVADGRNLEARTQMLIASNMAMQAFSYAAAQAPIHNFAHAIGARLHIGHGLACGVMITPVMRALADLLYKLRIEEFARAMGLKTEGLSPDELLEASIEALENLKKECGLPSTFPQKLTPELKQELRHLVGTDIVGFAFPIPHEAIDFCLDTVFTK